MFEVTMLPAAQGDSIWIEYGSPQAPHRILVDCGTAPTYARHLRQRIDSLGERPSVDLLVITHIDTDHIGGVLELLENPPAGLKIGQVWFNAWRHLPDPLDIMGPIDGEILSTFLDRSGIRWNTSFRTPDHGVRVPPTGGLRSRTVGGMKLTIVAPGIPELRILKKEWKKVVEEAGLAPGVPSKRLQDLAKRKHVALDLLGGDPIDTWADSDTSDLDTTPANGSSISILAEYSDEGVSKRLLLSGDAHGDVLAAGVKRLARQLGEQRLRLDAFKLPHHGSLRNVTRELVESVDCQRFLFSSNGVIYFHPDKEAVARVVAYSTHPSTLFFNYRTKFNELWDNPGWMRARRYDAEYGDGALTIAL